jgi:UDP-N-acetylmuramyl pentapeptide phosphotransferase/UDP-N-acetylglucosamine-1-phosphate transferase
VTGIITIAYVALPGGTSSPFASGIACSFAGASAGFLLFNLPPAKIFLGDSGSAILGFALAFLGLDFWRSHAATTPMILFPLTLAGLPLLDAGFAVVRRLRRGGSPLAGDRDHIYDLLLSRGYSSAQVALFCYLLTIALAGLAWGESRMAPVQACAVSIVAFATLATVEIRLGSLSAEGDAGSRFVSQSGVRTTTPQFRISRR